MVLVYFPALSILPKALGRGSARTSKCTAIERRTLCFCEVILRQFIPVPLTHFSTQSYILSFFFSLSLCFCPLPFCTTPPPLLSLSPPFCLSLCLFFFPSSCLFLLCVCCSLPAHQLYPYQHVPLHISWTEHPNLQPVNQDVAVKQLKAQGCTRLPNDPPSFRVYLQLQWEAFQKRPYGANTGQSALGRCLDTSNEMSTQKLIQRV